MADVAPAVLGACRAGTSLLYRTVIVGPAGVAHVQPAVHREQGAVAAVARGHHTVEEVDAPPHLVKQILRPADTHGIAKTVVWQAGRDDVHGLPCLCTILPHRQAADGIGCSIKSREPLRLPAAQKFIERPLHDGQENLLMTVFRLTLLERLDPALQPAPCALRRVVRLFLFRGPADEMVERHDKICPDGSLDLDYFFWSEQVLAAVDVAAEGDSLLPHLAEVAEGKNLETAAVHEDRSVPRHEPVQPAHFFENVYPGAEVEVIGVGERDLGAELLQLTGFDTLDRTHRADRHEIGGLHRSVIGFNHAPPRTPGGCRNTKELPHLSPCLGFIC